MINLKECQCINSYKVNKKEEDKVDCILSNLKEEEKQVLFKRIISDMMGDKMSNMKEMCSNICSGMLEKDESISKSNDSLFETEEIKNLFMDWVCQVQAEIKEYTKDGSHDFKEIADHFKISEESVAYFLKSIMK